jgi:hypothetical protein
LTKRPTISACLIVKDEAHNLARCLTSIVDLVDELIVVDTGSTDDTVAIAERFGAIVFVSPWRHDFAFHRNESFEAASGDWILRIDADEELVLPGGKKAFFEELAGIDPDIVMTRNIMHDIQGGRVAAVWPQYHFFRRGQVVYKNRKHNRPIFTGPCFHLKTVSTRHYGYDRSQLAGKKERDLSLLEMMHKEEPDNYEILLWKAQLYSHYEQDFKGALACLHKYIEAAADKPDFNQSAFVLGIELATAVGEEELAHALFLRAFEMDPTSVDLHFLQVREASAARNGDAVETACKAYLAAYEIIRTHPASLDGRLLYFTGPDALVYVLHKAAVCHLYRGHRYLDLFHGYIDQASPATQKAMLDAMATDLKKIQPTEKETKAA